MMFESRDGISFQSDHTIPEFPDHNKVADWLIAASLEEGKTLESLAYQFVTDDELLQMNRQFLDHDTYTDILTFPYNYDPIETDICISFERTRENAGLHKTTPDLELLRVMIHGLLHMCGYTDGTPQEKGMMREREDHYLSKWKTV